MQQRDDLARTRSLLASVVMGWMALFGMIGTALVGPNRPAVEAAFGLSHAGFGAAFAAIQLVCAAGALAFAATRARFDSIGMFIGSLAAQVAGCLLVALTPNVAGLALGWSLITLGTVLGSTANNLSARLWPGDPRRGVTLLHGFNGVGKLVGPLVAAALIGLDWRLSFVAVGGVTLVLLALFWVPRGRFRALAPVAAPPALPLGVLRTGRYWLCVLPFGLIAGGDVAFAALVPLFYQAVRGASAQAASLLLTVHLVGLVAGRFAFVALSRRLGNGQVIAICLAAGLGVVPAALSGAWWGQALGLALVGVMFSSTWPTFYDQAARFFPADMRHLLDYGSALGNALGIALVVALSSALAELDMALALACGPLALWIFGLVYWLSPLSRDAS